MSRPIKLFFSYSHKDEALRDQLAAHLATLQRKQVIDAWHDRKIIAGGKWAQDIDENLNSADIVLLLISPDFLNSEYCSVTELEQAMARHEAGQACVIPVILRHADWHDEPFAKLQALPKNAKPIVTWSDRDEAFLDVVQGIRGAVKSLANRPTEPEVEQETIALTTEIKKSGQGEDQYRDEVLFCLKQDSGEISELSRVILNGLQESLELPTSRAAEIEAEVSRPFQIFRQTVIDLKVRLAQSATPKEPLTPAVQVRLDRLQQNLKLSDEDASAIVDSVLCVQESHQGKQAEHFVEDLGNGGKLAMVAIPAGEFLMGSPNNEEGRDDSESPQHTVKISAFFMGKFAVTQAQWAAVAKLPKVKVDLKPDPARFKGAQRPVERVNWFEAMEFCDRLSQKTGRQYTLPSEAEWEYACRAGTNTPFHFGEKLSEDLANFGQKQTTAVGSFPANAFGLYDMHGNVWEWCLDHWHSNYEGAPVNGSAWLEENAETNASRVLRGGSWIVVPRLCRSAFRSHLDAHLDISDLGFRVVCRLPRTP